MPIYEYQCKDCKYIFERMQRITDLPPKCPECGGEVSQLLSAPAIQFKGSGWYVTDYKGKSGSAKRDAKGTDKSDTSSDVKITGSKVDGEKK